MIDHYHKLIFVHITRTGGTSVEVACVGDAWDTVNAATKHVSVSQAESLYAGYWSQYVKFSIVRNPFDRLASMFATGWWHGPPAKSIDWSMEDWLEHLEPHVTEHYGTLLQAEVLDGPLDHVIKFEQLAEGFEALCLQHGLDLPKLPHTQRSPWGGDYRKRYGDRARRIVEDRWAADLERFGYAW